jgi:hypothetical protein
VDQPMTERRVDARFMPPLIGATHATLRPGCIVLLVDLSASGALVQAGRPLRPGARVHLQMVISERTLALGAHVLRCAVWALDPDDGVTYRGALKFEQRCESFWERMTHQGIEVPGPATPCAGDPGNPIPAGSGARSSADQGTAK